MALDNIVKPTSPQNALFAYKYKWTAMFILLAANFLVFFDVNIVNVALPNLQHDFAVKAADVQWLVTAYLLVYALALLPMGRFGDSLGRKRLFIIGVLVFTVVSFLCGTINSINGLILLRGLQGFAAAMISPQVMAIAQSMFEPKERAKPFSLFGLIAGLAAIAGPLASGILIKLNLFNFGWRSIFYINIPIGLLIVLTARVRVPNSKQKIVKKIDQDWFGILLLALTLFALVYPLTEGAAYDWPAWCLLLMAAFFPLSLVLIKYSNTRLARGKTTLLPMHIIRQQDYILGVAAIMAFYSSLQGFFFVFVFFLQQGLHFSPFLTGLTTSAFPIGILVASRITGRLKSLRFKLFLGVTFSASSCIAMWLLVEFLSASLLQKGLLLPLFVNGLGGGLIIATLFQSVLRTVPLHEAGAGAGVLQTMQQIGGAFGVAMVSQIFFSGVADRYITFSNYISSFQHVMAYCIVTYALVALATKCMKFEPMPQFAS